MSASDPLRPKTLDEFVGQPDIVKHLTIMLHGAQVRDEVTDHFLYSGPPGTGKTTLAHIVAEEQNLPLVTTSGPALERPGDLAALLTRLAAPSVVFIDEIHRMKRAIEELLYPAMEDQVLDIMVGEGSDAAAFRIPLQPFVLVGATTQAGALAAPLRDRFGYHGRLGLYDQEALTTIITRSANLLNFEISPDGARVIADRSRGTPRIANRLLRRVRDWATMYHGTGVLGEEETDTALDDFGVDKIGLDATGRDLLDILCTARGGQPIGLNQIASMLGEDPQSIEEVYEPFLLKKKLIARTSRGRVATGLAYRHLGLEEPGNDDAHTLPGLNT